MRKVVSLLVAIVFMLMVLVGATCSDRTLIQEQDALGQLTTAIEEFQQLAEDARQSQRNIDEAQRNIDEAVLAFRCKYLIETTDGECGEQGQLK